MRSIRLVEIDFEVATIDRRTALLRPRRPPTDELTLPLIGQAILNGATPSLRDVIATTAELCLVADGDMQRLLQELTTEPPVVKRPDGREIVLPVCFEDAVGVNDWSEVEAQTGLERECYLARLSATTLHVAMHGFLPGFAYFGGLPTDLRCRRRGTPVARVEAGSVAVGGPWIGIYGLASPAGWCVLGRTPVTLVNPSRTPPTPLRIGDRVRLKAIEAEDYRRLLAGPSLVHDLRADASKGVDDD